MKPAWSELANNRILVIDDYPAIHDDLRKVLSAEGSCQDLDADEIVLFGAATAPAMQFEIDSAYQGEEGLQKVTQAIAEGRPYAMAFVDVRMPPGWDGVETITRLRSVDPNLQTVICTAYSDYPWSAIESRLGRSDYWLILKKPFDNIEVIQLAHAMCQKWLASCQVAARMADLDRIVAQRTAEAMAANELYRMIAENASDGIVTVSSGGRIEFANSAAGRIFGWRETDLIGRPFRELVPEYEERTESIDRVHAARSRTLELGGRHRKGRDLVLEVSFSGLLEFGGEAVRTAVIRDVTERRRAEKNEAQTRKLESIGRLASGIAHEINTPIQYIGDNLAFLERAHCALDEMVSVVQRLAESEDGLGSGPDMAAELRRVRNTTQFDHFRTQARSAIREAAEGVEHVAAIVRAVNEFAHPGVADMSPVDLNRLIESAVVMSRNRWKHVAQVQLDLDPGLPGIVGAAGELGQVFLNLLMNAADAIVEAHPGQEHPNGTIVISSSLQGTWAEVRVRDSGTGIPLALHGRIFDPFFTTKDVGRGNGQGLAIAHTIVVQRHRGTIDFETAMGQGTTFVVRLPVSQPGGRGGVFGGNAAVGLGVTVARETRVSEAARVGGTS
ncbi:MAG: PAS domain S-box protein [Acidobacteria bacterium]|nr:PAS domain S-box protein [Acidobacteriota bacterium]